jgi:hypothetical protein
MRGQSRTEVFYFPHFAGEGARHSKKPCKIAQIGDPERKVCPHLGKSDIAIAEVLDELWHQPIEKRKTPGDCVAVDEVEGYY